MFVTFLWVFQKQEKYDHAFDIAFEVETTASCETDDDYPTKDELFAALIKRINDLKTNVMYFAWPLVGLQTASACPFVFYE